MKVKWTTITKDKSTWPPEKTRFLLETEESSSEHYWYDTLMHSSDTAVINWPFGKRWRPMPKAPKKQIKQSPWKSKNIKPIPEHAILIKNKDGIIFFGTFYFDDKWIQIKGINEYCELQDVTEWTEIPE